MGLTDSMVLSLGVPVTVISAAVTAETGVGKSQVFTLSPGPPYLYQVKFVRSLAADPVALETNLEVSDDNGVTWKVYTPIIFTAVAATILGLVPGLLYRLNITSITSAAVSVTATRG